jgi:type I restriction-modification system DNA methylase subunit
LNGINSKPKEQLLSASLASFKAAVEKLTPRFESDRSYYLSKSYSEAQARVDFITPFFKALGWDMENEAGLPHHEREVIVEQGESETTGRPDYNFRTGGQTKFYVEAKPPSEGLDNPHHILQAKGYAWNTRSVFFVVLTDFEEFRFYDASRQPDERNPDDGLLLELGCPEYLENAEKLWDFSRERVAAGSLDALLPKIRRAPHLRKQVDEVFLDEMTGWREELAKDIHKQNAALAAKQLNEVVQRLLDRIVFIRIAEDRHVIEKRQLAEAVEEWETHGGKFPIFDWLNALFHKINEDFNGEIFKPHLSEEIQIDSDILARIIKRLYPPKSPYRFDVIGVELLGSIYERYLGNTIRLTPKQVRVEEKPEVRKAGGVYYTPKYIVDYIVKNTVGKVIEGKTPKQIERIRILDPACGSGSFLIGAFQYLIDCHTQWYLEHPEQEVRHAHPSLDFMREVRTDPDGSKRLSVYRKAKILRNNLFGVDIDPQAVEITMMSLYLKALEGEQSQLPPKQHLLPELKYNIMCGNSLIGPDIYHQGALFADEERDRINAFDWNFVPVGPSGARPSGGARKESRDHTPPGEGRAPLGPTSIGQVMRDGGFDCVIGNPPYVRSIHLKESDAILWELYQASYRTAESREWDIYLLFVEKGFTLLNPRGKLGYILPNKFLTSQVGENLRDIISKGRYLDKLIHFGAFQIFKEATTYTCLLFLQREGRTESEVARYRGPVAGALDSCPLPELERNLWSVSQVPNSTLKSSPWEFTTSGGSVLNKLRKWAGLGTVAEVFQGTGTRADKVYLLEFRGRTDSGLVRVYSSQTDKEYLLEPNLLKPALRGRSISRYEIVGPSLLLIVPYESANGRRTLIPQRRFSDIAPRTFSYIQECKPRLDQREKGRFKGAGWYCYGRPQNLDRFEVAEKIILPDVSIRGNFTVDRERRWLLDTAYGIATKPGCRLDPRYITGILNSPLLTHFLKETGSPLRGGYFRMKTAYLNPFPVRHINFSDPADKARHDKMVALVDRMLELNKRKHSGKLAPSELDRLEREIATTDQEIDELVYELYAVTDEEREVVEGRQT